MTQKKNFSKNILLFALCAFMGVLGVFSNISAPRAFADSVTPADVVLSDVGIVQYWDLSLRNGSSTYLSWTTLQQSGDNGMISTRLKYGYQFYNFYSSITAEKVAIFKNTTISLENMPASVYGDTGAICAVIGIQDTTLYTTIYIVDFFNYGVGTNEKRVITFNDKLINGSPFPEDMSSASFDRYQFISIQLCTPNNDYSPVKYPLQPIFNLAAGGGAYYDYYAVFTNPYIQNVDTSSTKTLKFYDFTAQVTEFLQTSASGTQVPIQNPQDFNSKIYKLEYQAVTPLATIYLRGAGESGEGLKLTQGSTTLQNNTGTPQSPTWSTFATTAGTKWTTVDTVGGYASNKMSFASSELLGTSLTFGNTNEAKTLYENFKTVLTCSTLTVTPEEPTTPPTQEETPDERLQEEIKKLNENVKKNTWDSAWLGALLTLGFGPLGFFSYTAGVYGVSLSQTDVGPALADKINADITSGAKNIIQAVGEFLGVLIAEFITSIGTIFTTIVEKLAESPVFLRILYIVLIVVGLVGGGYLTYRIIKKKREG